jgi:hypothetical protein
MVADSDTRMNQPSPIPGVIIGPGPILEFIIGGGFLDAT